MSHWTVRGVHDTRGRRLRDENKEELGPVLTGGKITRYTIKQSQACLYLSVLDGKQKDHRTHRRNKRSIADLSLVLTPMRLSWLGHVMGRTFI